MNKITKIPAKLNQMILCVELDVEFKNVYDLADQLEVDPMYLYKVLCRKASKGRYNGRTFKFLGK